MSDTQTPVAAPEAPSAPDVEVDSPELIEADLGGGEVDSSPESELQAAQDQVDGAKSTAEKQQAKANLDKLKKKYKIKVDGEELDWEGTDEDIVRELQLAKKARKEIQSSSELKKELEQFILGLKDDPIGVLSDPAFNVDIVKMAEQVIQRQIEEQMKSPEQLEKEKVQKELEELRQRVKKDEEERQEREWSYMVEQAEADLTEKIEEAFETVKIPKNAYMLKRLSDVMLSAYENEKNITPKQALAIVKKETMKDIKDLFGVSGEDLLEELLGSDTLSRLGKRRVAKMKNSSPANALSKVKDTGTVQKQEPPAPKTKIKIGDWLNSRK